MTYLANERHVAVNTQKVALNAVVFLYHKFLRMDLGELGRNTHWRQNNVVCPLCYPEGRYTGSSKALMDVTGQLSSYSMVAGFAYLSVFGCAFKILICIDLP